LAFLQHIILQHLATAVKYQGYRTENREEGGGGEVQKYFANAAKNRENHTVSGKELKR
jgi:hypothetical protein